MTKKMAAVLLAGLAVPAAALAQQKVDERRAAAADGVVAIENASGSVRVLGWAKAEIWVTGSLGAGAEGITLEGDSRRTDVEVEVERNPHGVRSEIEVHVPAGSRVEISTFDASIDVSDVSGEVKAESVNGSITVSGDAREVSVETVNGSLDVSGATARVSAETVNGSVTVKGVRSVVEASTVNGSLSVAAGAVTRGELQTVSGTLRFEGDLAKGASLSAESVSGAVEIALPAGVAADFSVTTFSGAIQNGLGPAATSRSSHTAEKGAQFSTGGGGASVSVDTLSGAIVLSKR
jgi:DUF4097 and DUF4098 domain-containing protein YvlB